MKYDPTSHRLETNEGKLIKKLHCPLSKQWNQLMPWSEEWSDTRASLRASCQEYACETDFVRDSEMKKYCGSCRKCVFDVNDFSEEQIVALVSVNPTVCIHMRSDHPDLQMVKVREEDIEGECGYGGRNRDGLLIIQTARSFAAIEEGIARGCHPLFVRANEKSKVGMKYSVSYNRATRELLVAGRHWLSGKEGWETVADFVHDNDKSASPIAAYMIPEGLDPGEKVYVADVIEDLIGQAVATRGRGGSYRLKSAEATWTGEDLRLIYREAPGLVG